MILFKKRHPRTKTVYAVTKGAYLGEMFILVENDKSTKEYGFLSLPDMHVRRVPYEKFDLGISNKIIDVVKKIPSDVYKTCVKQYFKNKSGISKELNK